MKNKNLVKKYNENTIRTHAINETVKGINPKLLTDPIFVKRVADNFMQMKINQFPVLCEEARRVNYLKKKFLADIGNPKGWSEKKHFKYDVDIPTELYYFMINLVAKDFWSDENKKINKWFMEGILKGEDSSFLLYRCKQYFEGNEQSKKLIVK